MCINTEKHNRSLLTLQTTRMSTKTQGKHHNMQELSCRLQTTTSEPEQNMSSVNASKAAGCLKSNQDSKHCSEQTQKQRGTFTAAAHTEVRVYHAVSVAGWEHKDDCSVAIIQKADVSLQPNTSQLLTRTQTVWICNFWNQGAKNLALVLILKSPKSLQ